MSHSFPNAYVDRPVLQPIALVAPSTALPLLTNVPSFPNIFPRVSPSFIVFVLFVCIVIYEKSLSLLFFVCTMI
jgi:hypothetical protein